MRLKSLKTLTTNDVFQMVIKKNQLDIRVFVINFFPLICSDFLCENSKYENPIELIIKKIQNKS